uniref:hypothetical protein n=1 Tax=Citrobacter amalonaticus TaxID=35703 RepID=UPI003BA94A1B
NNVDITNRNGQSLCLPGIPYFSRVGRLPVLHSFYPMNESIGAILTRWYKRLEMAYYFLIIGFLFLYISIF